MSTQYTAVSSEQQEEKQHIIEHVNADHEPEMRLVMEAFTPYDSPVAVVLEDIFVEGCQFLVNHRDTNQVATVFVPFTIDDEQIKPRIKGLVADARRQLGITDNTLKKRYFRVEERQLFTPNMLRLTLYSPEPLPPPQAAYACSFALKSYKRLVKSSAEQPYWVVATQYCQSVLLKLSKFMPKSWRKKLLSKPLQRAYTYRRIDTTNQYIEVDVYLHGDTPANRWAKRLRVGDVVCSIGERGEKLDYLNHPAAIALLCADETAMPAIAGILTFWQNPEPPIVVIEVGDDTEKEYFRDCPLPAGTEIICLQRQLKEKPHGELIVDYLRQANFSDINVAWGALEYQGAKRVREYLRQSYGLKGKAARIMGYWRQ